MSATKVVVILLLAAAAFAVAATGASFAFIGWIVGFILLGVALILRISESNSRLSQGDSNEDRT